MEIIAKISKGSKMDQIYIPKNRASFGIGNYVVVKPLETEKIMEKPYFYGVKNVEPMKLRIVEEVFNIIEKGIVNYDNIIITGSFLDKGFKFNDIDILIISNEKSGGMGKKVEERIGIKAHLILLDNKSLMRGASTDPLYKIMLSKCISKKRIILNVKKEINYKILDLHLLKSKILQDNFDILNGNEKYYLVRNMVAIYLFIKDKIISKDEVDNEIKKIFKLKDVNEVKENILNKKEFLKWYKGAYNETFDLIMDGIKNGAKQE